ncbi:MAG TPA: polysaccharide deacetylase family protein [Anaerolineae bacterium]|nr:polysaccharide deacetylase family protein [Anaerolineae bacterium]HOQ98678.1 polysaccharide deacetylase family protein [Anaerolineae bacterium]HPL26661.1 polysaccharide deacetylase family protein [Anaerolineae bacterium]
MSIPILLYHSIADSVDPRFGPWALPLRTFAEHMQMLHDEGYSALTVTQLAQAIAGRGALPARPVVITFDDGFADFLAAVPVLQRFGFAATLYVTTAFVGGTSRFLARRGEGERPMLTWPQLAELEASSIELGAHGHQHVALDVLPRAVAWREIICSKHTLEQRLGRPVQSLAYPYGYYDRRVRRLAQLAGYSSACAARCAMSGLGDDRFALARITVEAGTTAAGLRRRLTGEQRTAAQPGGRLRAMAWRLVRRIAGPMVQY